MYGVVSSSTAAASCCRRSTPHLRKLPPIPIRPLFFIFPSINHRANARFQWSCSSNDGFDVPKAAEDGLEAQKETSEDKNGSLPSSSSSSVTSSIDKDIGKAVRKTAATFAPRASTASKNPAVPGTALYTVFEVQGYASMLLGGALSFNVLFPSNEPDLWRLMGMWSIWMFTVPSLRARDCSKNEKEALNYLFLVIPLLNVIIPFFWKSFSVVWSVDTVAFFIMYAWKLGWFQKAED